ncbi:cbb3-type cytochrome c oxidase subunit 3 [Deefgea sp. CFH1-16]|uniref:cbb3-type cytochrome oxidase subunit 3 n=1 Tax=Deefgea sp. CFH1-16 TaxID=2675457 RepID=UPI0015F41810|nr:cbb3-type cytochrome c oxidase subunit 3 [Deefgea sp. CFH1-16]MBM5575731.1 CcoQ/FixQ family Cbb3-type cytochrome c oxidase assembly chaperone [Deefgea sp. CFH1-16]
MGLTIYHWILIVAFVAIVIWVFGKKQKKRFEEDAKLPFDSEKTDPKDKNVD